MIHMRGIFGFIFFNKTTIFLKLFSTAGYNPPLRKNLYFVCLSPVYINDNPVKVWTRIAEPDCDRYSRGVPKLVGVSLDGDLIRQLFLGW